MAAGPDSGDRNPTGAAGDGETGLLSSRARTGAAIIVLGVLCCVGVKWRDAIDYLTTTEIVEPMGPGFERRVRVRRWRDTDGGVIYHGRCEEWNSEGKPTLQRVRYFRDGVPDGPEWSLRNDGSVVDYHIFKNRGQDVTLIRWEDSGVVHSKSNFRDWDFDGSCWWRLLEPGQDFVGNFRRGLPHGLLMPCQATLTSTFWTKNDELLQATKREGAHRDKICLC